jgi:nucleoside-diphosphate-sugar epimerase
LVIASTPSIYTRAAHQFGLGECSPLPEPLVNAYARTKLEAERAVLAAAAPGFATVALRPRAVIGPHDTVLLPRLLRAAAKGVMPLPGMGRALIEPSDARDIAAAFIAAEARAEQVSGQVFNLSGGIPLALADLAAHTFDRLNRKVRLVPLPARAVLALARLAEGLARLKPNSPEPAITAYSAMALGWSQTFDLTAAREKLGWQPRHHPLAAIDRALEARG